MAVQSTTSMGTAFLSEVGQLLETLGYTLQTGDDWLLGFSIQSVEARIKNACNVSSVPDGLKKSAVKMAVGEFLNSKKGMGALDGFSLNIEPMVKQIKEGDTDISYAVGTGLAMTPEQQLDSYIKLLMNDGVGQFASYRRVAW